MSKAQTAILKKELAIEKVNFEIVRNKFLKNREGVEEIKNYRVAHKSYTLLIKKYNKSLFIK